MVKPPLRRLFLPLPACFLFPMDLTVLPTRAEMLLCYGGGIDARSDCRPTRESA